MLPRVFVDSSGELGAQFTVRGEDGRHFAKSLRVQPGEEMIAATLSGPWLCEIVSVEGSDIRIRAVRQWPSSEASARVTVVQGVAKGDKMDSIVQKCTEIGVSAIIAYDAERSVSRIGAKTAQKMSRWQKVIREAAMQSQRDVVPDIWYEDDLTDVFRALQSRAISRLFVLDEDESQTGLKMATRRLAASSSLNVAVFIGPEGGIGRGERALFEESDFAQMVTMGPRILRTETAGAVAVAMILSEYGDMGG